MLTVFFLSLTLIHFFSSFSSLSIILINKFLKQNLSMPSICMVVYVCAIFSFFYYDLVEKKKFFRKKKHINKFFKLKIEKEKKNSMFCFIKC